ncbi:ABC transporter ATP-binding protein [Candidatus Nanogingivalis gingivitcus]|jgi:ABC transporter related protein|uniref:ABC-type transporter ATP-binding protein EcsA n=1 Tax=Candidatus Nanogingivalis gingivitcus TaxID=2171992 RepID=A0ABY0FJW1_9BACT|nr:ATP-binding cassette domain-containing protein [Candidatus Nanogingivalis gingivitcus]RYC72343.1 ABC-type transporter ATP-binding protein EcsA [Candidatus Nanogingivalis gingivitcus]
MSIKDVISIKDFSLSFGKNKIIDNLSFEVRKGEIFGFLGSNGSGKTTTIRALLGIYEADKGDLLINGKKFSPENGNIGYLPEERGLYKKEKVLNVMIYFAKLKGLKTAEAKEWSLKYLKRVGLENKANLNIEKLSGGQQQKIQLGLTIIGEPDLLILDEPTKGFDPVNRELLMEIIKEENQRGATVVMVTHQMEEVEKICHRAILLKNGKKEAYGTPDEIRDQYGEDRIIIEFTGELSESKNYKIIKKEANYAEISPLVDSQVILKELVEKDNLKITNFNVQKSTLNEIFLKIYGEQNDEIMEVENA